MVTVRLSQSAVSADDAEQVRCYLEDFLEYPLDPAPAVASRVEARLAQLGTSLFGSVFDSDPDARDVWGAIRGRLASERRWGTGSLRRSRKPNGPRWGCCTCSRIPSTWTPSSTWAPRTIHTSCRRWPCDHPQPARHHPPQRGQLRHRTGPLPAVDPIQGGCRQRPRSPTRLRNLRPQRRDRHRGHPSAHRPPRSRHRRAARMTPSSRALSGRPIAVPTLRPASRRQRRPSTP
jgi:hypothetical protein